MWQCGTDERNALTVQNRLVQGLVRLLIVTAVAVCSRRNQDTLGAHVIRLIFGLQRQLGSDCVRERCEGTRTKRSGSTRTVRCDRGHMTSPRMRTFLVAHEVGNYLVLHFQVARTLSAFLMSTIVMFLTATITIPCGCTPSI